LQSAGLPCANGFRRALVKKGRGNKLVTEEKQENKGLSILTFKPRLPTRFGVTLLGVVIAIALVLSPGARRLSNGVAANFRDSGIGLTPQNISVAFSKMIELPRIENASTLSHMLTMVGYHLEEVRAGSEVPRLSVKALPGDLKDLDSPEARKMVFIKAMLPLVLQVNEEIVADRARVLDLNDRKAAGQPVSADDQAWLASVYNDYGVALGDSDELLRRLDVVPVSLALGQAALESGWGTSRFAQEGNALFGQIGQQVSDTLPMLKSTADGTLFRSFNSLSSAVRAYVLNLNTHNAYRPFRQTRASLRKTLGEGRTLDGLKLVVALKPYSERGTDYLDDLRGLIRVNKLQQFDNSRLTSGGSTADAGTATTPRA
jgi:Bax protein